MTRCFVLPALVAVALAVAAAMAAGGGAAGPQQVTLAQLSADQEKYSDQQVRVSGVVRRERQHGREAYYVLADARRDEVLLTPASDARRYAGRNVTVTGTFELDPKQGWGVRFQHIGATPARP
jgi:hypothetical protein